MYNNRNYALQIYNKSGVDYYINNNILGGIIKNDPDDVFEGTVSLSPRFIDENDLPINTISTQRVNKQANKQQTDTPKNAIPSQSTLMNP